MWALLTAPISVVLISWFGWKGMYLVLGLVGIIWAVVWLKVFTDYTKYNPRGDQSRVIKNSLYNRNTGI